MTLLQTEPVAGGQPPATLPVTSAPLSGAPAAPAGEQTATGKDKAVAAAPAAPAGKDATDNGQGKPADASAAVKTGAPETYEFKPSPDGEKLGEQAQTALTEVARELNLTNDAAQKLVDKMAPALKAQQAKNIEATINGWVDDSTTTFGDKLNETVSLAQRAIALATPEMRKLLGPVSEGGTGLGNHKAILAGLAAIGAKLSPDTKVVTGSTPAAPALTALERLAATYETR